MATRTIRVKFSEHDRAQVYSYRWTGEETIQKGDFVCCETPIGEGGASFEDFEGFVKICKVVEVIDDEDPRATKPLFGLVVLEPFLRAKLDKKRAEKRRKKLRAEMEAKLAEARARKELEDLAAADPEAKAMLDELAALEKA